MIHNGRHSATIEDDFVVFLIGARINRWWKAARWLPVVRAMGRMQAEIGAHPEIGCLHIENFNGRTTCSIQYWRSYQHVEEFARSPKWSHLPAWKEFNRLLRDSGDLGIWHETYRVAAGEYEAIYGNMPTFGLARAGVHGPVSRASTAARRIGVRPDDQAPVEAY